MDSLISIHLAELLGRSVLFDETILTMSSSHLVKGGFVCAIMAYIWVSEPGGSAFESRAKQFDNRLTLIAALLASVFAEALALVLANGLEFRLRPLLVPELEMPVPERLSEYAANMAASSSFPSDHAVLFSAITTGIFLVSRLLGLFVAAYCLVFIAFPRVYLGLHYVSDILVGAIIGVVCTVVGVKILRRVPLMRVPVRLSYSHPAVIAPLSFLFLFQVATMLEDARDFLQIIKSVQPTEEMRL